MSHQTLTYSTLATTLWPGDSKARTWRIPILVLIGVLALTVSAKVQIPFYPVPMTMQTLVVLLTGIAFGTRLGVATVLIYLGVGALGLPVFAGTPEKGVGLAYMLGPTGGYLAGFVLAAATCGWLAERGWDRRPVTTAAAMLAGNALIYLPGLLWLGTVVGWDKPVFQWGLTPFLLGDLAKLALAAGLVPLVWKAIAPKDHQS
jgi:biotin transport system substrate-specific component